MSVTTRTSETTWQILVNRWLGLCVIFNSSARGFDLTRKFFMDKDCLNNSQRPDYRPVEPTTLCFVWCEFWQFQFLLIVSMHQHSFCFLTVQLVVWLRVKKSKKTFYVLTNFKEIEVFSEIWKRWTVTLWSKDFHDSLLIFLKFFHIELFFCLLLEYIVWPGLGFPPLGSLYG